MLIYDRRTMNILLVSPWSLTSTGGVTTAVRMLRQEFRRRGHQAVVLVANGPRSLGVVDDVSGTPVYALYLRQPHVPGAPIRGRLGFALYFPWTLYQLHRLLARHEIDAVIVQYPLPNAFYFGLLRRLARWRLVVTYQGNDAHDLTLWPAGDRRLVRTLLESADCVTGVSHTLLQKVAQVFTGLKLRNTTTIPNGAPVDRSTNAIPVGDLSLPPVYIVTVGHLIHRKGIDVLIRAVASARSRGHALNLVVVGDGPEHGALAKLAADCGIADRVHFIGNRSHSETLAVMQHALFFVLASRAEGLPLVIAEAMSCGKAVIASRVDGIPEIVQHGRTGLLVDVEDVDGLADGLGSLERDAELRQRLGLCGREWARREYNWETIAQRYLSLVGT